MPPSSKARTSCENSKGLKYQAEGSRDRSFQEQLAACSAGRPSSHLRSNHPNEL